MRVTLRYDLRGSPVGASQAALHEAALDQCEWMDRQGFISWIWLSEHHRSDDGYMPSPLVIAAAIAARTTHMRMRIAALLLPMHDPIRIAEDAAVVDIISKGRLDVVLATGYVPSEFAMFGKDPKERWRDLSAGVEAMSKAWTGEEFEFQGRRVRVTPRPYTEGGPPILFGGSRAPAGRRAALMRSQKMCAGIMGGPEFTRVYLEECQRLGVDPGRFGEPALIHQYLYVSDDPERDWKIIAPRAIQETHSFAAWSVEGGVPVGMGGTGDADELRRSGKYLVMTPEECVEHARELGPDGALRLHPLMGGLDPEFGWRGLRLFTDEVAPHLRDLGLIPEAPV